MTYVELLKDWEAKQIETDRIGSLLALREQRVRSLIRAHNLIDQDWDFSRVIPDEQNGLATLLYQRESGYSTYDQAFKVPLNILDGDNNVLQAWLDREIAKKAEFDANMEAQQLKNEYQTIQTKLQTLKTQYPNIQFEE